MISIFLFIMDNRIRDFIETETNTVGHIVLRLDIYRVITWHTLTVVIKESTKV